MANWLKDAPIYKNPLGAFQRKVMVVVVESWKRVRACHILFYLMHTKTNLIEESQILSEFDLISWWHSAWLNSIIPANEGIIWIRNQMF